MKWRFLIPVLLVVTCASGVPRHACPANQPPMDSGQTDRMNVEITPKAPTSPGHTQFTEHYTMLYYSDLGPADWFYGELLRLERSYEDDWVRLYRTTASSYVGVVREGPGAFHRARPDNAVMVSLVTADVDAVYARVREHPGVEVVTPLHDHDGAPIRAFILRDPGGYTVEVFEWLSDGE
jgi:predicted enzyme related to lactoylglutathione lyase